jgi:hypothetical protein
VYGEVKEWEGTEEGQKKKKKKKKMNIRSSA